MNNEKKFIKLTPFKMQVLQTFPFIDADFDAITNYELLCKVVEYLNITVDNVNILNDEVEEYINKFNELKSYVDNYFTNLDVQQEINNKLDEMAQSGELGELIHKLDDFSNSNKINTGNNLLTNDSLWLTHDGWTGDATNGFVHTVGKTGDLEYNYNFEGNKTYLLEFTVTTSIPSGQDNNSNDFTVVIGNTEPIITYRGGGSMNYKIALKPTNQGSLKFKCVSHSDPYTPSDQFVGNIHDITLKELTGDLTQLAIKDINGDASLPFSIMLNSNNSVAIGNEAGIKNYNQTKNVYIGYRSGKNDSTGYFNTGIGSETLQNVINASRNTAIGKSALANIISGDRNTAIGTFAMSENKYGRKNIAIGFDTMMSLQSGEDNMAIGNQALISVTNVKNQLAIGPMAMGGSTHTGDTPNIAIGRVALYYNTSGGGNIGVGANSLYKNSTGNNNVGIGNNALNYAQTVSGLIGIGSNAANRVTSGGYSVIIGSDMNQGNLAKADRSVAVGSVNLQNMTELTNSVIMGYNIKADSNHTALQNVIAINTGRRALSITRDNYINIANTIYADTFTVGKEKVGIGVSSPNAWLHLPASSSDGGTAPLKFTAGTLMNSPENGAFEFDGTHLYFTIGNTRNTII